MASRLLIDCVPELQGKIPLILEEYNQLYTDRKLIIICTLRSTIEQQALYAIGRTKPPIGKKYYVTQLDGIRGISKHNPTKEQPLSRAVDFGVIQYGKYIGDNKMYEPLFDLCRKHNLRSGWDFNDTGLTIKELIKRGGFIDAAHVEVK